MAKETLSLKFRPERAREDQQFHQTVRPLMEQFIQGLLKEDAGPWGKLCDPQAKLLFRYLGYYNTYLTCDEWAGLFKETKKRWWGRQDGSGEPIVGSFKKIWLEKLSAVAKHHEVRGVNVFVQRGNALDQPMDQSPFVDLTWSGPKEYGGMGWYSIRLFFNKKEDQWFLTGLDIFHWTI